MVYLLTAIGLSTGGISTTHIYTNNTQNDTKQTIYGQHNNKRIVRAVPRLGVLYHGICLTNEEKARKKSSQGIRV